MMAALRKAGVASTQSRATRVGVAVQGAAVRVVGVQAGRRGATEVCWAIEGELEPDESVASAVRELLAGAPMRRWPAAGVVVAVGGHAGQVKPLHGLPAVRDPRVLEGIVGASPQRFFLRNGVPVTAGGVRVDEGGATWGTAFASPLAGEMTEAVRGANARLLSLTTLPVALGGALASPDATAWCDDEDGPVASRYEGRRFAGIVRGVPVPDETSHAWAPALAALGDGAPRFAAAYGAAVLPADEPLVLRPVAERSAAGRRRLVVAGASALACTVLAFVAPPWRAARLEREARAVLVARGPRYAAALHDESRLAATDAALAEVAAFDVRRVSRLELLDRLTTALPEGSALVSLRADTSDVSLVVVAPRIATVTAALERAKGLSGLALVGAVSREMTGGRELERATYKLRLARGER